MRVGVVKDFQEGVLSEGEVAADGLAGLVAVVEFHRRAQGVAVESRHSFELARFETQVGELLDHGSVGKGFRPVIVATGLRGKPAMPTGPAAARRGSDAFDHSRSVMDLRSRVPGIHATWGGAERTHLSRNHAEEKNHTWTPMNADKDFAGRRSHSAAKTIRFSRSRPASDRSFSRRIGVHLWFQPDCSGSVRIFAAPGMLPASLRNFLPSGSGSHDYPSKPVILKNAVETTDCPMSLRSETRVATDDRAKTNP